MCPVNDGQPVSAAVTNPAFLDAQIDDTAFGVITLANTTTVVSGATVTNTQQYINDLISTDKIFIRTSDNSKVSWDGIDLSFTADLLVDLRDVGFITRVLASNSPIAISDGQSVYFNVNRTANASVLPIVGSTLPLTKDSFRFCTRVGTALFFFDNTMLRSGYDIRIGEAAAELAQKQEIPTGLIDGMNQSFTLTSAPVGPDYLTLFVDSLLVPRTEYSLVGTLITFTTAPVVPQTLWAVYIYQGAVSSLPAPTGVEQVEYRTVSGGEFIAGQLTLAASPADPSKVMLFLIGGSAQFLGTDFTVAGNVLSWNGLDLDGVLIAGDRLMIHYFS